MQIDSVLPQTVSGSQKIKKIPPPVRVDKDAAAAAIATADRVTQRHNKNRQ